MAFQKRGSARSADLPEARIYPVLDQHGSWISMVMSCALPLSATVERYVQDRDRGTPLRSLWDRMQQSAEEAGTGPEDVEEAVRAVRRKSGVEEWAPLCRSPISPP
jgi:hypothetical protein